MTQEELKKLYEEGSRAESGASSEEFTGEVSITAKQKKEPTSQDDLSKLFDSGVSEEEYQKQKKLEAYRESARREPTLKEALLGEQPSMVVPKGFGEQKNTAPKQPIPTTEKPSLGLGLALTSFGAGAYKMPLGVAKIMQDLYNVVPPLLAEEGEAVDYATWATQQIADNNELIAKVNKELGYKEGELSPDDIGQIFAEMATAPLATLKSVKGLQWLAEAKMATTTKVAIAEAPVAAISELGSGGDYVDASKSAVVSALFTKVGGEAIQGLAKVFDDPSMVWRNIVSGKATDKQAYDFLVKKSGEADSSIAKANQQYADAIGKKVEDLDIADKTNALLNNTDIGAKFKMEAEYYNEYTLASENKLEETMTEIFKKETAGGSFDAPALKLKDLVDESGKLYGELENTLLTHFDNKVTFSQSQLSALKQSVTDALEYQGEDQVLKGILNRLEASGEGINLKDLIAMNQAINSRNLKGTKGFTAKEIKGFIDEQVKKSIGNDSGYQLWKETNKRYGMTKSLSEDNELGKLLLKRVEDGGRVSAKDLANSIVSMGERGHGTFNDIVNMLGEDVSTQVEKEIVNTIISKEGSLSGIADQINNFEFASKAGQSLQREINRASGMISDVSIKKLISKAFKGQASNVGWSDNLISKLKFTVVGKVWDNIGRRLPSGETERAMMTIGDIIKGRSKDFDIKMIDGKKFQQLFEEEISSYKKAIKDLDALGSSMTNAQKMEKAKLEAYVNKTLDGLANMQKQIGYTPKAYVSTKGTVSGSPEASSMADQLKRAVESRAKGRTGYSPSGKFQDVQAKPVQPISGVVEDAKQIPYNKTSNADIIDTEAVQKVKLTPEQAKRINNLRTREYEATQELERLKKELKSWDKSNLSKSKIKLNKKRLESKIMMKTEEIISIQKKYPKEPMK